MSKDNPDNEIDIYKDTPVRLLGYLNEAGESLRGIISNRMVRLSYTLSTLYVVADTVDKAYKGSKTGDIKRMLLITTDTFIWQMLASVAIPGYLINRICWGTRYILKRGTPLNDRLILYCSAATGLCSIPFVIEPIDTFCDRILDDTIRKLH